MKMELGTLIRQVSHEREIEPERLVAALEDAISQAVRKHYRERGVRTHIDLETGEMSSYRVRTVVATPEEVTDPTAEVLLEEAREIDPAVEVGGEIVLGELDTASLGRIAAQAARQMLFQRVREAERDNIYNDYIGKQGELVNGIVKRFERGDIVIELGRTEGVVTRQHQVRHERYSQGDRIRAVIVDVTKDANKPQVVLSRTAPQLLIKLLEMEVPEIYDGTVIVKGCVREPGERAKVAVTSRDRDVDPVGACVGMKGSRVQAIMRELKGEKVDIIPYNPDIVTFAQSALAPAKINRVALREQSTRIPITDTDGNPAQDERGEPLVHERNETVLDVIVSDEQLSLAIGKRGQNVRLASRLLGCRIEIKSEEAVKDEVAAALAAMLRQVEGVTDEVAADAETSAAIDYDTHLPLEELSGITDKMRERLLEHGFSHAGALAAADPEKLMEIPGIGPHSAAKLIATAKTALAAQTPAGAEE
ncbi:MAG: transcription termination factor NusA [Thermoanaerobaculaceae bacterium]|nr:transcription termination factor NusA [Thermoanaerobaculaceae bacterium]TAM46319.1 MAG: transcription termination factor NusA [Acidobacteriota bacterium]